MVDIEKKGSFYLGRPYDWRKKQLEPDADKLLFYDAGDLTTHAVCVGMTGSGKTGLCLALLEEAALDGIPAIAIDPKGDLGNLLLAFPQLQPQDFRPWIDESEAQRKSVSPDDLAAQTAQKWRDGLAQWGEDGARIERFRQSVDFAIYTPGSNSGLPLTVLRSFAPPPPAVLGDADALRERLVSTVSGLLALLGVDADPMKSREHILLSQILEHAWRGGQNLDLPGLIRAIQSPPFDKVGFVDLESFFPAKDRTALSLQLNNLLASPGFSSWLEGEPLDIERLFHTPQGKPRLTIINIAHLNDAERMSFVTIFLGELLAWVRAQPGTSSLRALFYMDEVFGYFPPSRNPPSKTPMLTLLKQARAFGLGIVLATQNPVDLDYKGLSNAGTWFLGRLQTERDKARVIEGLEGASAAAGAQFDRAKMEQMLSALGNRVFLMNNVHDDQPIVFQTRWCLSYLGGPLTRVQIQRLMQGKKSDTATATTNRAAHSESTSADLQSAKPVATTAAPQRPLVPQEAGECFAALKRPPAATDQFSYRPALLGVAKLHYVDVKRGIDQWENLSLISILDDQSAETPWTQADQWDDSRVTLEKQPNPRATYSDLPAVASRAKSYAAWQKDLATNLYSDHALKLWQCESLGENSKPGENEADFRARLAAKCRELGDVEKKKLCDSYGKKLTTLDGQIQRAKQRVETQKGQRWQKIMNVLMSLVSTVLGALGGRKLASQRNITAATTAARRAGGVASEQGDVKHAEESLETLQQRRDSMQAELDAATTALDDKYDSQKLALAECPIHARKTDIAVNRVTLVWLPYRTGAQGQNEPAY